MKANRPVAIDCFAGAGGLALGLKRAGFEIGYAFDSDSDAISTYRRNFGTPADACAVEEVTGALLLERAGLAPGECALLAGGPPCQGFSRQRRGEDRNGRNALVLEFLRLVLEVRPMVFLMENVPAIRSARGLPYFEEICRRAKGAGYSVHFAVLDAAEFGVPQHRKRLFLVGTNGLPFAFPAPTHGPGGFLTVADALGGLPSPFLHPEAAGAFANHEADNISALNRLRISHVPPGGGRADIPPELRLPCHAVSVDKAGHRGVYGRLAWDRPAGTITTKCNSFTRGRFAHPEEHRNISMREAARLQSFPDEFIFDGDKVSVAHQVGNAVPPLLAEELGAAVLRSLAGDIGMLGDRKREQLTLALVSAECPTFPSSGGPTSGRI